MESTLTGEPMNQTHAETLYDHRKKCVAKNFYRELRVQGFTHQQIIELSAALLGLVTDDLKGQKAARAK